MLFATVVATVIPVVEVLIDGVDKVTEVDAVIPVVELFILVHVFEPAESYGLYYICAYFFPTINHNINDNTVPAT